LKQNHSANDPVGFLHPVFSIRFFFAPLGASIAGARGMRDVLMPDCLIMLFDIALE